MSRAAQGPRSPGERLFALLVRLLPGDFRQQWGDELLLFYRDRAAEPRYAGAAGRARLWAYLAADLATSAVRERRLARRAMRAWRDTPEGHLSMLHAGGSMDTLLHDVRSAARALRRRPGFTLVASLTLAIGIGASTAIFSAVSSLLLQPLRFPDSHELVTIEETIGGDRQGVSFPNFVDWRERSRSFDALAIARNQSVNFTGGDRPDRLAGTFVSAGLFPLLGASPLVGRGFLPAETEPATAQPVVVLGERAWRERFGSDPRVVGRVLTLNGTPFTVVGVMPSSARLYGATDVWLPVAYYPNAGGLERGQRSMSVLGRLATGTTIDAARRELGAIAAELERLYPKMNEGAGVAVSSLHEELVGDARPSILILSGAVGLVLLIACANVANLHIAHAVARRREMSVRAALGAGRRRIVRQLLTESLLLALLGAALGLVVAHWGVQALVAMIPMDLALFAPIVVDARALAFATAVALGTGALFGLAPALQGSRSDLATVLAARGSQAPSRVAWRSARIDLRGLFVVAQIALSIVLLVSAGLLTRSMRQLGRVDPGFDPRGVMTMEFRLPPAKYDTPEEIVAFFDRASEALNRMPGVESAALVRAVPFSGNSDTRGYVPAGITADDERGPIMLLNTVGPGYFETMRIELVAGRTFDARDRLGAPGVIVVSEEFARREWPGRSALGERIRFKGDSTPMTVVGVVRDVKHFGPADGPGRQGFVPYMQNPQIFTSVVARASGGDHARLGAAMRDAIWSVDRDQPVWKIRPMPELMRGALDGERATMGLIAAFAATALLLAAIGIYAVMSHAVSQRTREVGIRMALGARREAVLGLVVREGLALTAVAAVVGVVASLGATRLLASQLYGVSSRDPLTFVAVPLLLALVALLACWLPARRASRVDPMVALRSEG